MPAKDPSKSGGAKSVSRAASARKTSAAYRDWHGNKRKSGAPFGRYEDMSALPASAVSKKAVKRGAAEGPKKSVPVAKKTTRKKGR